MSVMSESETLTSIAGVIISSSDRSRSVEDRSLTLQPIVIAIYVLLYDIWWHNKMTYFVCEKDVWQLYVHDRKIVFERLCMYITVRVKRGTTQQSRQMVCSLITQTVMLP